MALNVNSPSKARFDEFERSQVTSAEVEAALVSAHVELFDEERHRLETWRRGAVNHRSIDREREKGAATLVSAHVELSDEERYRLETWRIGAAHHRSTDCGRVDALDLHSRLV
ncbi:hypothetical protein EVAR_80755_1 [Eumeta japonica]|uniref:Uncharacterized protein n=1 Tax=Eumeta variegata TaxID=151549 RepID=A0A4C1X6L2_EUMVA|nr:hypothetical protein EVAR_80755_1 [Eumeta japonica]